ncbi:histidine kinase [Streptomyces sp. NBC_00285]|uniref:sensor histidine kinase n=1 Tax=Streptomyces sp. NBC_00285 TaxID=2975700 RepID=UPI002E2D7C15|nr:histidine kinase [Streptomyces sp. NBC_00285]
MPAPSAPAPAPHPDERQFLQALTSDPEQRVIASVVSRLASWRRADRAHPWVRRWGVPVFCLAVGSDAYANPHNVSDPQLPIVLAFCIPLLWRERRPLLVFALTTAVSIVSLPLGVLTGAEFARVVALFNVGRHCSPRQLAAATGVTLVQLVAWAYFFWRGRQLEYVTRPEPVTLMVMVAMAAFAALGLLLRLAYAYIDALKKQRDQQARLATAQERTRVSREMHDILGHTLAVIVGLADGAAALAEAKPERGAQTLRLIGVSGRDALAELRRLLAVIGDDHDDHDGRDGSHGVPLAPQPGLADLDALLDRVRAAGPTVALHAHGDLTGLAPGLQLSVYRIVQEALTNTVKYAVHDTSVHVSIAVDPDTVRLTVEDTGPPRSPRARRGPTGGGRGLVGMRERAALYRGEVTAGPNPHGGWTVHAVLHVLAPSSTATTTGENPWEPTHAQLWPES